MCARINQLPGRTGVVCFIGWYTWSQGWTVYIIPGAIAARDETLYTIDENPQVEWFVLGLHIIIDKVYELIDIIFAKDILEAALVRVNKQLKNKKIK